MAEDGEDDLEDAASDRQDVILEASWRALGGSGGSKPFSRCENLGVKGAARRDARSL